MRWRLVAGLLMGCAAAAAAGDVVVQKVQGEVRVRQGVTEVWNAVAVGDVLKPNDTMRTGNRGSAVLVMRAAGKSDRKISLPADVLVDVSDIRDLTQEELMLKLTMAKVRSSSYEWKEKELQIPNATVVHGQDNGGTSGLQENTSATGTLQWNGVRVLVDHGFYSTGVLRMMEVFLSYPALAAEAERRIFFAEALEKSQLRGEALAEYGILARNPDLTPAQRTRVESRLHELQK